VIDLSPHLAGRLHQLEQSSHRSAVPARLPDGRYCLDMVDEFGRAARFIGYDMESCVRDAARVL